MTFAISFSTIVFKIGSQAYALLPYAVCFLLGANNPRLNLAVLASVGYVHSTELAHDIHDYLNP